MSNPHIGGGGVSHRPTPTGGAGGKPAPERDGKTQAGKSVTNLSVGSAQSSFNSMQAEETAKTEWAAWSPSGSGSPLDGPGPSPFVPVSNPDGTPTPNASKSVPAAQKFLAAMNGAVDLRRISEIFAKVDQLVEGESNEAMMHVAKLLMAASTEPFVRQAVACRIGMHYKFKGQGNARKTEVEALGLQMGGGKVTIPATFGLRLAIDPTTPFRSPEATLAQRVAMLKIAYENQDADKWLTNAIGAVCDTQLTEHITNESKVAHIAALLALAEKPVAPRDKKG